MDVGRCEVLEQILRSCTCKTLNATGAANPLALDNERLH